MLGLLAYQLLIGGLPTNKQPQTRTTESLILGISYSNADITTQDFLIRLLMPDPKARMSTKQALNHSVFNTLLQDSPQATRLFPKVLHNLFIRSEPILL
jgi:serine/threonine protein kinase